MILFLTEPRTASEYKPVIPWNYISGLLILFKENKYQQFQSIDFITD